VRAYPIVLTVSLLGGCYLVHEHDVPTPSIDASVRDAVRVDAIADDAVTSDASCTLHTPATIRFEPPLMSRVSSMPVVLRGITAEPASNGVRIQLDTCDGTMPCPLDLVVSNVGDALAMSIHLTESASGMLSYEPSLASAGLSFIDARTCPSCGGALDIVAGAIVSGLGPDLMLGANTTLVCTQGCVDEFGTFVTNGVMQIDAVAGVPADMPPLHARIASNASSTCARCDCSLPAHDPTGVAWMASGTFAR
jgi:hypothetical protein